MTMNLEKDNEKNQDEDKKIKHTDKVVSENKKVKKYLNKNGNRGVFRNNYKNYQYDYEEDFYEPY